ncbi:hypothetical protein U9M48_004540, partial [Paspalum notatum var. saurae]
MLASAGAGGGGQDGEVAGTEASPSVVTQVAGGGGSWRLRVAAAVGGTARSRWRSTGGRGGGVGRGSGGRSSVGNDGGQRGDGVEGSAVVTAGAGVGLFGGGGEGQVQ